MRYRIWPAAHPDPRHGPIVRTMNRFVLGIILATTLLTAAPAGGEPRGTARQITWDELVPEGWVPPTTSIDHFFDAPPQPLASADVPVVEALDQQRVRLPGYLVPIDLEGDRVRSFLMVPYFGACIHVPPPPPNQVVFVTLDEPVSLADPYGAHWVTGVLSTHDSSTDLAEAAYSMQGERVETFSWDTQTPEAAPSPEGDQPP